MLALSTFRRSERAIDLALRDAAEYRRLVVCYVADVNLARYLVGQDLGLFPELEKQSEQETLREHEEEGRRAAAVIAERAAAGGIEAIVYVRVGRFAEVCLEVVRKERPCHIVTTRSRRPEWVRRFFGSPVDRLRTQAGCPVVEA
jgi:nucleotide-binding universal stress UspA family protein